MNNALTKIICNTASCTSRIFAARALDFAVKFRFVFRYENVVFRRYFKLYCRLVFVESSRLSWSTKVLTEAKNLGTFHIFKNSAILRKCCYGFKLSSPVFPREPMTCADVIQLCRLLVDDERSFSSPQLRGFF